MENNNNNKIINLSDADFLSFLYAERDRENSLSRHHGWSNWAIAGALITSLCTAYITCKESSYIEWDRVLYYSMGVMAFFLTGHAIGRVLKIQRGVDYTRVRLLKDVTPKSQIILVLFCSTLSIILIPVVSEIDSVFCLWLSVFVLYVIAAFTINKLKNNIVAPYIEDDLFPDAKTNIRFNTVLGGVYGFIGGASFEKASWSIYNNNFELAMCLSACLILIYLFCKMNMGNKSVKEFDLIIDDYIYKGETKERTYKRILINRMGLDLMDTCEEELQNIKKDINTYSDRYKLIERYNQELDTGFVEREKLISLADDLDDIIKSLSTTLDHVEKLHNRLNEALFAVPSVITVPGFKDLLDLSGETIEQIKHLQKETSELVFKANKKVQEWYG